MNPTLHSISLTVILNNIRLSGRLAIFAFILSAGFEASSQSISPATINTSGNAATFGNYQFEWSVGESSSIVALTSSNIVVTSGVLQSYAAHQPALTNVPSWEPGEVKLYPVPTRDVIEINMLARVAGKTKIELFDLKGNKLKQKEFYYAGVGLTEKWNLAGIPSGQYFIHIQLVNSNSGKPLKKGAFKILKIQ